MEDAHVISPTQSDDATQAGVHVTDTMWLDAPWLLNEFFATPTAAQAHRALLANLKRVMEEKNI